MSGAIIGFLCGMYFGWMLCGVTVLCLTDYIFDRNEKHPLDEKGGD